MSSSNTNSISSHTFNSGENCITESEPASSIATQGPIKKIKKTRGRGKRGKQLRNNICNIIGHLRNCPPRKIRQENIIKYHRRISRILKQSNFENSSSWKPNDLQYTACNTSVAGKKQLSSHFRSAKHKINIWNCTPKY